MFLSFTVKRVLVALMAVSLTLFSHIATGVIVFIVCVTAFGFSLVPGVFENRFKYALNMVLELYVMFVGSSFILMSVFADLDT